MVTRLYTDGCHHVDSLVDELPGGQPVYACIICERQVVEEPDGTYVPVVATGDLP